MHKQTGSVLPRAHRLISVFTILVAVFAMSLPAQAEELRGIFFNGGDIVKSAITPEGDVDTLVFDAFADSILTIEVKRIRDSSLTPGIELLRPDGTTIDISSRLTEKNKKVILKKFALEETGRYGLRVYGRNDSVGDYKVKSILTPPRTTKFKGVVSAGKTREFVFGAADLTRIYVDIEASPATVTVDSVVDPDDFAIPGAANLFQKVGGVLSAQLFPTRTPGDYRLVVQGAEDDANVKVKIKTIHVPPINVTREISSIEPNVEALDPDFGREFNGIAIEGSGFQPGNITVLFDDIEAPTAFFVNSTRINVIVPAEGDRSVVDIRVYNPDGQDGFKEMAFTFIPPPPDIDSITPTEGPDVGGTTVTVFGENFTFVEAVILGQDELSTKPTVISDTEVQFVTDPHAPGLTTLLLRDKFGQTDFLSSAFNFAPPPVITDFTPLAGTSKGGTQVTINGSGFRSDDVVYFGDVPGDNLTVVSASKLFVQTPAHPLGTVDLKIVDIWQREQVMPGAWEFVSGTLTDKSSRMPPNDASTNGLGIAVAIGDVDPVGLSDRVDIILGAADSEGSRPTRLFLNEGNTGFEQSSQNFDSDITEDLVFGDLDGDGDLDLVCTNEVPRQNGGTRTYLYQSGKYYYYYWYYFEPYVSTRVFKNDGQGSFIKDDAALPQPKDGVDGSYIDMLTASSLALGDLDGDKDLDLIVTSKNAPYVSYMYDYSTYVWSGGWYYYYFFFTYYVDPTQSATRLLVNDGKGTFDNETEFRLPPPSAGDMFAGDDVIVGDIDGDGDIDIIVTGDGANLRASGAYEFVAGSKTRILTNDGDGYFDNDTGTLMPTPTESDDWGGLAVGIGDLDGDQVKEIVITTDSNIFDTGAGQVFLSSTRVFQKSGDSFVDATKTFLPPVQADGQGDVFKGIDIAVGDPDGNGVDEIFILLDKEVYDLDPDSGNYDRQISSLRWFTKSKTLPLKNATASQLPNPELTKDYYLGHALQLGDLDGDGDLDLVLTTILPSYTGVGGRPTRILEFE